MGKIVPVPPEKIEMIEAAFRQGKPSFNGLAKQVGVAVNTVRSYWLRWDGVTISRSKFGAESFSCRGDWVLTDEELERRIAEVRATRKPEEADCRADMGRIRKIRTYRHNGTLRFA